MKPLRIGHLSMYFGLFDDAMPDGFRATRESFSAQMHALLARHGDVVDPGLVDDEKSAIAAGRVFGAEKVDVVVFAPTMAAPPGWAWNAVADLDVPIIAVGAQEHRDVPDDYDTEAATARSLPVGLVMFTNVLVRHERPFLPVVGELGSEAVEGNMARALRAAAAVAAIRRGPLLAIGTAMDGYDDVLADDDDLRGLGAARVSVEASELDDAFASVDAGAVETLTESLRASTDATVVSSDVLDRSVRLSLALDDLAARHRACGGAVNCHGPMFRRSSTIGVTACLGVSRSTEAGTPFACTGDVPTGVALVLGKALAGSALYCELYQLDLDDNWLLVANGGEGDMSIREPGTPVTLLPEEHYAGEHGAGTAVAFEITRGPATLASLSPVHGARGGWVLVAAPGEVLDSRHAAMEGPNGMFRFASGPVDDAYARWCTAGATHHAMVLPGAHEDGLADVARLLGIELRIV